MTMCECRHDERYHPIDLIRGDDGFEDEASPCRVPGCRCREFELIEEPEQPDPEDLGECHLCGGPLVFLGQLGNEVHSRCRNCGMNFDESDGIRVNRGVK